jgi:glycosyltransferase 2 family protein
LSPADAAVLFAVMIGVALVPFTVGGWGLRELAVVTLFGNYGLSPERALVFSMYFGLTSILASLPGVLAWLGFMFAPSQQASGLDPQV